MVEITLPIILQILQTAGILVGIVYYITIMRNSQRAQELQLETRQAQLFMNIYNQFIQKGFSEDWIQVTFQNDWESLDDYWEKYGVLTNPKGLAQIISILAFFEGIGVLLKRKLIAISMVDDLMSSYVLQTWNKYGPTLEEARERLNRPELWEHVSYLYDEIQKAYKKQHGHDFPTTDP